MVLGLPKASEGLLRVGGPCAVSPALRRTSRSLLPSPLKKSRGGRHPLEHSGKWRWAVQFDHPSDLVSWGIAPLTFPKYTTGKQQRERRISLVKHLLCM